jgi:hypothetical protein
MRLSPGALAAFAGFSIAFGAASARAQGDDGDPAEEQPDPSDSSPTRAGRGIEQGDFDNYAKAEEKRKKKVVPEYGVGLRLRGVFEPAFMMNLFVEEQTSGGMFHPGFGLELNRRKGNFELVLGFEYENLSPDDGYWLEKGDDGVTPGQFPDFIDFDGLSWFTTDLTFMFHAPMSEKVAFRYGAGFGLGIVFGDALQTDSTCTGTDFESDCTPNTGGGGQIMDPADIPPVFPVVNLIIGTQFRPSRSISINVETGIRTVFFFGLSGTYYFNVLDG